MILISSGEGTFDTASLQKMSATLSYNTDFAAAETDARQVNLTRFSLFFPEKRRFFLEDAGVFEFGGLSGRFRRRTGTQSSPVILPYFSRRIGLNNQGQVVPLLGAAKTFGSGWGLQYRSHQCGCGCQRGFG